MIRIKIMGKAGNGVISAGEIFTNAAGSLGFYASLHKSIPSSIEYGLTSVICTVSECPIQSPFGSASVIAVLHSDLLESIENEVSKRTIVFINETDKLRISPSIEANLTEKDFELEYVPFQNPLKTQSSKMMTMVALGILVHHFDLDEMAVVNTISEMFVESDQTQTKIEDFRWGFSWASRNRAPAKALTAVITSEKKGVLLDGNQLLGLGAIAAGCRFFSSYPITPATGIGDLLANVLPALKGFAYQAEDEISAISAVAGASFCGKKAMTATSGPGFSLMQEMIGYLSITELPSVIVNVMRAGPSTGMPTKHAQEDLMASVFGGHGEDQRIVLAPTDLKDCFEIAVHAFRCAEKYRCPVVVLSDFSFAFAKNTINDRTIIHLLENEAISGSVKVSEHSAVRVTGLEHDKNWVPTEDVFIRGEQVRDRFNKLAAIYHENENLFIWDMDETLTEKADIGLIGWGVSAMIIKEAVLVLRGRGVRVNALLAKLLYPVNDEVIRCFSERCKKLIIPESNYTGQYASLLTMYTRLKFYSVPNLSGEPFTVEKLLAEIDKIINRDRSDVH